MKKKIETYLWSEGIGRKSRGCLAGAVSRWLMSQIYSNMLFTTNPYCLALHLDSWENRLGFLNKSGPNQTISRGNSRGGCSIFFFFFDSVSGNKSWLAFSGASSDELEKKKKKIARVSLTPSVVSTKNSSSAGM